MKTVLSAVVFSLLSFTAHAQDMSRTETYEQGYIETADGGSQYVGRCTSALAYDGILIKQTRSVQPYIGDYRYTRTQMQGLADQIDAMDANLLNQVLTEIQAEDANGGTSDRIQTMMDFMDDITVDEVSDLKFPDLNLVRFNIGVGGGNGEVLVYSKTATGYVLVSSEMDGDINFCDQAVWSADAHPVP